jgi:flagellar assembly protein FliH
MSNLWSHQRAGEAASVGSFAIDRGAPMFTPWGGIEQDFSPSGSDASLEFEASYASGFAQGFEQGRQSVEEQLIDERAAMARMAESLQVLQPSRPTPLPSCLRKRWTGSSARSSATWKSTALC